jgi:hypothetical protein
MLVFKGLGLNHCLEGGEVVVLVLAALGSRSRLAAGAYANSKLLD